MGKTVERHFDAGASSVSAPSCPVERSCGACQLLAVPYEMQLVEKQRRIADLFSDIVDEGCVLGGIAGMDDPFHYRNKAISPFAPGKRIGGPTVSHKGGKRQAPRHGQPRHEILCGMYAARTHRIVPTETCLIENETAHRIILAIRDAMLRFGVEPYREDTGTGFMRHAVVRVGQGSGEVLVTLVTNGDRFIGARNFVRYLVGRCPEITTVVQNVNLRQTNVVLGEREQRLYGPGFILDTLCGLSFRISSHSFYQVNVAQTEVLYRRAIEMARLDEMPSPVLVDAYCGTGTIGLVAARSAGAASIIGVDKVPEAVADARQNARHNGIGNAAFVVADAGMFLRERAAAGESVDVVLMDPPRSGASVDFLDAVARLAPTRVVYISCNPETQVRDALRLKKSGYEIRRIQPVDMFPHTRHIENICLFEHRAR